MATYGYGRVSTNLQTTANQQQDIERDLGVKLDYWFADHAVSGKIPAHERPEFSKMAALLKKGDRLVISRVDRISRSASDVLVTVEGLMKRGVDVYILQVGKESLSSPMGKFALGIFSIFAENERMMIVERVRSGLARTVAEGTILGKPRSTNAAEVEKLVKEGFTQQQIADRMSVSLKTIQRVVNRVIKVGAVREYDERSALMKKQHIGNKFKGE
jgi:putative DNA-invertase from lambdoid prophage Rac